MTVALCANCEDAVKLRAYRNRRFTIYLCDGCATEQVLTDEESGREFRVVAVAVEAFG